MSIQAVCCYSHEKLDNVNSETNIASHHITNNTHANKRNSMLKWKREKERERKKRTERANEEKREKNCNWNVNSTIHYLCTVLID